MFLPGQLLKLRLVLVGFLLSLSKEGSERDDASNEKG